MKSDKSTTYTKTMSKNTATQYRRPFKLYDYTYPNSDYSRGVI